MSAQSYRVAVGADHGGVELKNAIVEALKAGGHEVVDYGTHGTDSVDYSDFANEVGRAVHEERADRGVLVCTSGVGVCLTANRFRDVRAANVRTVEETQITRSHNDANVLCLGQSVVSTEVGLEMVAAFLSTAFEGGRHEARLCKASGSRLAMTDSEVFEAIRGEEKRQRSHIELIASENFASPAVMEAQGSLLTNKYAEGYPGRRWYGGCENVDVVEELAINRLKEIFGADHANVQPHSGSQANTAVYFAVLQPGDKILTMDLAHGGHLTHGRRISPADSMM